MDGTKISGEYVEACLEIAAKFLKEVMEDLQPEQKARTTSSNDDDDDDDDDDVPRDANVSVSGDHCDPKPRIVRRPPDDPKGGDCYNEFEFMALDPGPSPYDRLEYVAKLLELSKVAIGSLPRGFELKIKQL